MSRKHSRFSRKNPIVLLAVAVIGAVGFLISRGDLGPISHAGHNSSKPQVAFNGSYNNITVVKVVDGDTLKLAGGERVRLIGIDTPEMHESQKLYRDSRKSGMDVKVIQAMGRRAAAFTRGLVEGKTVKLEFDAESRDKYRRLLAYVYLSDGTFVNAEIIRQGYASPMKYPPNIKHSEEFQRLYREAQDKKIGLWNE